MPRAAVAALVLATAAGGCAERTTPVAVQEDTAAYRSARELLQRSRFVDAAARYAEISDSFAAAGDSLNQWFGRFWWTEAMMRAGERDSSRRGLARAYELAGAHPRRLGFTHVAASHVLERAGELDSSAAMAGEAVAIGARTGDLELGYYAHDALGTALSLRGRYREALAADSTSLAMRRALGLPGRVIAQGLNEVGIGYRHLGRYDDAVRVYEESFELARQAGDTLGMALARGNLANVRTSTGDSDRAIELLLEALRYVEAVGHRRFMLHANDDLAGHYLRAGRHAESRDHATRALELSRATRQPYGEQRALLSLGEVDLAEGRIASAAERFGRALVMADSLAFGQERVDARIGLTDVEIARRRLALAEGLAAAAVTIADSLGDPAAQVAAREARARALAAAGAPGAGAAYGEALDSLESIRGRLALGDLRMGVGEPRYGTYEGAIATALDAGRPDAALIVAERARARGLLELMADRAAAPGAGAAGLRSRLREAYESRAGVEPGPAAGALDREIERLADSLALVERTSRAGAVAPSVAELQSLAADGRAVVSYFWGERAVYGWWLDRDALRAVRLGSVDTLARTVDFVRGAIDAGGSDSVWRAAGRRLHRELIAPLGATTAREIVVIPDGPLHQLPFELALPPADAQPWGATRVLGYGPSAAVLTALAARPAARWERELLAVGNPTAATVAWEAGAGVERGGATLATLTHAEPEARAIGALFGGRRVDLLLGGRATVRRWLGREPGRYRFLHFALHAVASDRRPERSGLLFAGEPLDLAAIRRLRLQAELVTLSACETGVGRWVRGEGILGMQHAFLAAGARGVVVSLWRVADRGAADFMTELYAEILGGSPPAAALTAVRGRWLADGGERADPRRWAAFVYVGAPAR